jgi:hypothetical protein
LKKVQAFDFEMGIGGFAIGFAGNDGARCP